MSPAAAARSLGKYMQELAPVLGATTAGVTSLFPGLSRWGVTRRDLGAKACYFWAAFPQASATLESLLLSWLTQEGSHDFRKMAEVQAAAWASALCLDIDCVASCFLS